MKYFIALIASVLVFTTMQFIIADNSNSIANESTNELTAYIGATLIDGNGGSVIEDSVVLISGDRIIAAGPRSKVNIPSNTKIITVTDKYIVPGFIDTHVHFFESGRAYMNPLVLAADKNVTQKSEERWLKDKLESNLSRYLCSGVTSAVSLGGPTHIEFGVKQLASTLKVAPRVFLSGTLIANDDLDWYFDGALIADEIHSKDNIIELVRQHSELGVDLIKFAYVEFRSSHGLSLDEFIPILEAGVEEAHKLKLPVFVHIETSHTANALINIGLDSLIHLPGDKPVN